MLRTNDGVIATAAQLYNMRTLIVEALGVDKFRAKVEAFRPLFAQVEKANDCTTLGALMLMIKTCEGDAIRIATVCAVAVEIMEPSIL